MTERITALRIQPRDNVATCVLAQRAGETAVYADGGETAEVRLREDIPFGHKLAIRPIAAGEEIVKYGYPIGRAIRDIPAGEHVHVHNVGSLRCNGTEGGMSGWNSGVTTDRMAALACGTTC